MSINLRHRHFLKLLDFNTDEIQYLIDLAFSGAVDNFGKLVADDAMTLTVPTLNNAGSLVANNATLTAENLENSGLLQAKGRANVITQDLQNRLAGRIVAGGVLVLQGHRLNNVGKLQGQSMDVDVQLGISSAMV